MSAFQKTSDRTPGATSPKRPYARVRRLGLVLLFAGTLLATLSAGLWPFLPPRNDAVLVSADHAIRFGRHGTVLSKGALQVAGQGSAGCSLELWLQPAVLWSRGTVLAIDDAGAGSQFTLNQDYADLVLRIAGGDPTQFKGEESLRVKDVFRKQNFLLTISSDGKGTTVYIDGKLVANAPAFPLSSNYLSGQLILGNAPVRDHSWSGEIRGLAVYRNLLDEEQVTRHGREWKEFGGPQIESSGQLVALYRFQEPAGRVVRNSVASGVDLEIPPTFQVWRQIRFESLRSEAHTAGNYARNNLLNILGFIPLGFVSAWFFTGIFRLRWPVLAATLLGFGVSLTIEYLQSHLPTRYSGVTDLITNPAGSWIGAMLQPMLARLPYKKTMG